MDYCIHCSHKEVCGEREYVKEKLEEIMRAIEKIDSSIQIHVDLRCNHYDPKTICDPFGAGDPLKQWRVPAQITGCVPVEWRGEYGKG